MIMLAASVPLLGPALTYFDPAFGIKACDHPIMARREPLMMRVNDEDMIVDRIVAECATCLEKYQYYGGVTYE
jgi:hypothetical protein